MAAICRKQDLGVFKGDYVKIIGAASFVSSQPRTTVGKYTILDRETDPKFSIQGRVKKVFYCFSEDPAAFPFLISIALRGQANNKEMQNELAMYQRLSSVEGITRPRSIQQEGEFLYLILDLFNEGALTEYILANPNPMEKWQRDWIFYSLLCTLSKCHDLGVVLRDLKGDNILVRRLPNGMIDVKITDLGLALYLPEASEAERRRACGTGNYLAPEVFSEIVDKKRCPKANFSLDLWALGVVFYGLDTMNECLDENVINQGIQGIKKPEFPPFQTFDFGPFTQEVRELLCILPEGRSPAGWLARRASSIYHRVYAQLPSPYKIPAPVSLTMTQILTMCKQIQIKSGGTAFDWIRAFLFPMANSAKVVPLLNA